MTAADVTFNLVVEIVVVDMASATATLPKTRTVVPDGLVVLIPVNPVPDTIAVVLSVDTLARVAL